MKSYLAAIATFASVIGTSALAADMAIKAPAAPAPAFDWSGIYFGGEVGWQGSRIGLSGSGPGATLTYDPHHDSVAAGGFGGIQRQFGQIVVGVEGGAFAGFGNANLGATPSISIFIPGGVGTAQASMVDIWSVGGRLGWAAGYWMPYVTGGYASGLFDFNAQDTANVFPLTENAHARTSGDYIGGGVDWAVTNNVILGVEYRHYWFNSKTVPGFFTASIPLTPEQVTFAPRTDTVMARASYKFNWPFH
jgi:outer membrane immunogenic protein